MTIKRLRSKHQLTLQDRIVAWAKEVCAQAATLPPGPEREMLIKKVRQAETALHFDDLTCATAVRQSK